MPALKDRAQYEPWLVRKPKPKIEDSNPYDNYDAGAADPGGGGLGAAFGGDAEDAGIPWYLRDWDGGKPMVTLDDLREDGGPIIRRMVKGFYVALDTDIEVKHIKWWKTTGGYLAPYDRMIIAKQPTDFHGVWLNTSSHPPSTLPRSRRPTAGRRPYWLDKPPTHLPVAFVVWPHSQVQRERRPQKTAAFDQTTRCRASRPCSSRARPRAHRRHADTTRSRAASGCATTTSSS